MKRRTFYQISLTLPYITLIVSLGLAFLTDAIDSFLSSPFSLDILKGLLAFFGLSGIIWGPLYTWMVIVMLIWGRKRKTEEVRLMYLLSPVLLAFSMGIPAVVFSSPGSLYFLIDGFLRMNNLGFISSSDLFGDYRSASPDVFFYWIVMAGTSLLVGYVFVGIVLLIERVALKRGMFKDEPTVILDRTDASRTQAI